MNEPPGPRYRAATKEEEKMAKYRKKPVVIEAVQWDGNLATVEPLLCKADRECVVEQDFVGDELKIETLEGTMTASLYDFIILGVKGELYPCKPDIFEATYEPVEEPTP